MTAKYARPAPMDMTGRERPSKTINTTPIWCAVDLRDGNQALPNPMAPEQKRRYFQLLTQIGFKEIEIGFPSASVDDFQFCRDLIEQDLIPDDVTISVLVQARDHLIRQTFEALRGVRKAVCHVYTATSDLHMNFVFGKSREETQRMATDAVGLIRELADAMPASDIRLEFSPEEFTDTDLDFAVSICDAVVETWGPKPGEKVILNLPATVERRPPNEYADMIEAFISRQRHRAASTISLHAHNDMGCAVAATQLSLMAGADRVEGTLFGHGERSGNVDLVTLVLNLQYLGIETGLDFSNLESISDELIELTSMPVSPRHPYVGELVFTAFSGSHQDAIHKGLNRRDELADRFGGWKIPYLHIDPADIGRTYERFIRINSQSGKGGVAHILQSEYGVCLPRPLLQAFSRIVQAAVEARATEIGAPEVWELFNKTYARPEGPLKLVNYWPRPNATDPARIDGETHVTLNGTPYVLEASAVGPIAAFVHSLRGLPLPAFTLEDYEEDAIGKSADAKAIAFVKLKSDDGETADGVGIDANIDQAAVKAIVAAVNGLGPWSGSESQ